MTKFYLILATLQRRKELNNFLKSLNEQTYKNFELIVVDQNDRISINDIVTKYTKLFPIHHIKMKEKGLSLARNVGIKFFKDNIICNKEMIVAFPDDDCEYPPKLLENVYNIFKEKKEYQIITGISIDRNKYVISSGKFGKRSSKINYSNIFKTAISYTIFIKFSNKEEIPFFDEKLGIGTFFGSSEETDYIYLLLKRGYKGFYYPEKIFVYHPIKELNFDNQKNLERVYNYSLGMGAFYKKHLIKDKNIALISSFFKYFLIRPIGGMILGLLKFNVNMLKFYKQIFIGRWKGLVKYE